MNPSPPSTDQQRDRLARLGTGGAEDRLDLRLVLHILWRSVPLLKEVRAPLVGIVAAFVVVMVVIVPLAGLLFSTLWDGVLRGEPLTSMQARFLWLDLNAVGAEAGPLLDTTARARIRNHWVIAAGVTTVLSAPIAAGFAYAAVWLLQRINQILRLQLLDRLQALSLRYHADSRVGDAIYRIYQDSAMVTGVINTLFLAPARFAFTFLLALGVLLVLHPGLAALLLAVWIPALWLARRHSSAMRRRFRVAREANSALTSHIQEVMEGIRVIKAYGAEPEGQERFEDASRSAFAAAFDARYTYAWFTVAIFWCVGPTLLAGAAWSAWLAHTDTPVFAGELAGWLGLGSVWGLGVYNFFKSRMGGATQWTEILFGSWARAQDITIGLDRVFEVLDLEPEIRDAPDAVPFDAFEKGLRFDQVRFAYSADRPVLDGIDLVAAPGSVTALVGPTGSGKSTLVSLLLRLYDPDQGTITIDGRDLREFQVASLRQNVAIALQENLLFGTTVRENIRFAVPDATDAQVAAAAHVACADEFIEALPLGYDTPLGERGTKLSTGQRQRLSIARALLKDTPILILDEPTASLDAETELEVLRRLVEWGRGRAIFLITHRLSTIRSADRIAYLEDGRIEEAGSHDELMQRPNGAYRRLVELELGERQAVAAAGGGA